MKRCVGELAGIERELASRDQRVLRWFGHVGRMDEHRMARRVLMAEVSRERVRGRPRLGWMDGVKVALGNRGMTVEAARQLLLFLKKVGSARLRESDIHHISPKTPAPQYQPIDRKKRNGKRVEDYI